MRKTLLSLFLLFSAFLSANAQREVRVHLADGTVKTWKVWEVESIDFAEEEPLPVAAPGEPVDLGFRVKWASINLGAAEATETGHYYGWGEKSGLIHSKDLKYYPYPGISQEITASVYDMATAAWGELWRLPSQEEFQELVENCDWEAVDGGYKLTSKLNGNSIFLPYVNYRDGEDVSENSGLFYWTGDIASDNNKAVCLGFTETEVETVVMLDKDTLVSYADLEDFKEFVSKSEITAVADVPNSPVDFMLFHIQYPDTIITYEKSPEFSVMPRYMGLAVRPVYGTIKPNFDIVVGDIVPSFDKATISASLVRPDGVVGYGIRVAKSQEDMANDKKCTIQTQDRNQNGQNVDNPVFDVRNLATNTEYYFQLFAYSAYNDTVKTEIKSFVTEFAKYQNEYVDLGTGILWAKFNVGAEKPTDIGNYYAWGELQPKSSYSASNYNLVFDIPISGSSDRNTMTLPIDISKRTIGNVDGYMISSKEYYPDISGTKYDVAKTEWGGTWRMPTKEEWKKLSQSCTWTYTTVDGVPVFKVANKQNSSKYIYLPAGGIKYNSSTVGNKTIANYWSSTLWTYTEASYYGQKVFEMECKSTDISDRRFDANTDRFDGCLVRPVMNK